MKTLADLRKNTQDLDQDELFDYLFDNQLDLANRDDILAFIADEYGEEWVAFREQKVIQLINFMLNTPIIDLALKKKNFQLLLANQDVYGLSAIQKHFLLDNEWKEACTEYVSHQVETALAQYDDFSEVKKREFKNYCNEYKGLLNDAVLKEIKKQFSIKTDIINEAKIIPRAFKQGNTVDLVASLDFSVPEVIAGAINRSNETQLLQQLINDLLDGNNTFTEDPTDNTLYVTVNKQRIKFSDLLDKADFNHLDFTEVELGQYEKYIRESKLVIMPQIGEKQNLTTDFVAIETFVKDKLTSLSFAEKLALNIYSADINGNLNKFLRKQFDCLKNKDKTLNSAKAKEFLLACAIGIHGLNRVPRAPVTSAYRVDKALPEAIINERKQAALNKTPMMEFAFLSTAFGKPAENFYHAAFVNNTNKKPDTYPVGTLFIGHMQGIDISSISAFPAERELLLAPVQVLWQSILEMDDGYYCVAMPVRSPEKPIALTTQDIQNLLQPLKSNHGRHDQVTSLPAEHLNAFYTKLTNQIVQYYQEKNLQTQKILGENLLSKMELAMALASFKIAKNHKKPYWDTATRLNSVNLLMKMDILGILGRDIIAKHAIVNKADFGNAEFNESKRVLDSMGALRLQDKMASAFIHFYRELAGFFSAESPHPFLRDFVIGMGIMLIAAVIIGVSAASYGAVPALLSTGFAVFLGPELFWTFLAAAAVIISGFVGLCSASLGKYFSSDKKMPIQPRLTESGVKSLFTPPQFDHEKIKELGQKIFDLYQQENKKTDWDSEEDGNGDYLDLLLKMANNKIFHEPAKNLIAKKLQSLKNDINALDKMDIQSDEVKEIIKQCCDCFHFQLESAKEPPKLSI